MSFLFESLSVAFIVSLVPLLYLQSLFLHANISVCEELGVNLRSTGISVSTVVAPFESEQHTYTSRIKQSLCNTVSWVLSATLVVHHKHETSL